MIKTVLLLTKNYPPQIGGIEKYSFDLYNSLLRDKLSVFLLKSAPRNEFLFSKKSCNFFWKTVYIFSESIRLGIFFIKCITYGFYYANRSDLIWSLDGSISWLGYILGFLSKGITRTTLHGTDVVWPNKIYQFFLPWFWKKTDEIFAISENTKYEIIKRGVPVYKISEKPHKKSSFSYFNPGEFDRDLFLQKIGITHPQNKTILFSIGRWIERKGFHWFLNKVVPHLNPEKFHYIIAGFGPYENEYKNIIASREMSHITLLGKIDEDTKAKIFLSSQYFIMPNIPLDNDVEGFGLVLLESQHYGLHAIVSDVDGIGKYLDQSSNHCSLLKPLDAASWISFFSNVNLPERHAK